MADEKDLQNGLDEHLDSPQPNQLDSSYFAYQQSQSVWYYDPYLHQTVPVLLLEEGAFSNTYLPSSEEHDHVIQNTPNTVRTGHSSSPSNTTFTGMECRTEAPVLSEVINGRAHNRKDSPMPTKMYHNTRRKSLPVNLILVGATPSGSDSHSHNQDKSLPNPDESFEINYFNDPLHVESEIVIGMNGDIGDGHSTDAGTLNDEANSESQFSIETSSSKEANSGRTLTPKQSTKSTASEFRVSDYHKTVTRKVYGNAKRLAKQRMANEAEDQRASIPRTGYIQPTEKILSNPPENPRKTTQTLREPTEVAAKAPSSASTKDKENHLIELPVDLPKLRKVWQDAMIPLKECVPRVYANSSKKPQRERSKFDQLFGSDTDDDYGDKSTNGKRLINSMPWRVREIDDYIMLIINRGQISTCDAVFETALELNVDESERAVAEYGEIKLELEIPSVAEVTVYSDTVTARQACGSDETETVNEINNLMEMHWNETDIPIIFHNDQCQELTDSVQMECGRDTETEIRSRPARGRARGRGRRQARGRGGRYTTRATSQSSNVEAIATEFCKELWELIFYNVKNCEILVRQTKSYTKIQPAKEKINLVLKHYHQAREKEVEELARLTLGFLRQHTISNFIYKQFLKFCYEYGRQKGMRVTVPALVKFLFSVVLKIKEMETNLEGFVRQFCAEVEGEYDTAVRRRNVRDDFILPKFPHSPPPLYPLEAAIRTEVGSSTFQNSTLANIDYTDLPEYSEAAALVRTAIATEQALHRMQNAMSTIECEPKPEPSDAFTAVQKQLLKLQVLQYHELFQNYQRLVESARQEQWHVPHYYYFQWPRIGVNDQTDIAPPAPPTNAWDDGAHSDRHCQMNDDYHSQEQITNVSRPSTPECLRAETAAQNTNPGALPSSEPTETTTPAYSTVIKRSNSPPAKRTRPNNDQNAIIDLDQWYMEKMRQSDFIDLDDYDGPIQDRKDPVQNSGD
ncbi:hypothetical protein PPYR_13404 [Photinus pyralis]|uniref:Uncharacterized protein n=2 Tax=Photinus pyralis TaxID=7054 RepID=A0A5N4A8Z4_PHOPY|nr:uncharacterized protein LOC116179058 [Photinus pyralis]KAB0793784.1 hypothetical protein PPYR_13404 [Photinus pyralis]